MQDQHGNHRGKCSIRKRKTRGVAAQYADIGISETRAKPGCALVIVFETGDARYPLPQFFCCRPGPRAQFQHAVTQLVAGHHPRKDFAFRDASPQRRGAKPIFKAIHKYRPLSLSIQCTVKEEINEEARGFYARWKRIGRHYRKTGFRVAGTNR